ncbi:MAG: metal-transporting ATPase [Gammaproteobacteria bacterium 39-13]|nr:heavy metal translocating P-type ATPase [Gammaproteobacteria bacterium]OJV87811.1 MAG: metal-transporting ATPase [Gammaproteobacteria bacterium 39-13]
MSNSKLSPNFPIKFRWQLVVTGISLLAIAFSILFQVKPILSPELPLLIVIVVGGIPSVIEILLKLFKGDLGADLLAAIALITAVILNEYLAAVFIILMISSGQALEAYAMRKASSVLLALAKRMPSMVHQKIDNRIEDIPLVNVQIGDNIVIYPHETCPVDGIVVEGQGSMDESYLTGEPYQMSKVPGTSVISGAINGETVLTIQAQKLPSESRYASIVSVLEEAEQKKPTLRRLGDKIGAIFAPIALVLAFVTWYMTGDEIRFLAVLVIATPCPLLIAIPITVISAISMAAKQSIIIKDPTVLESLSICRTAIFDKTGTLTYGKPILSEILTKDESDSNFVLQNVASLERYSKHPLAGAILDAAKKAGLPLLNATRITEPQGKGLSGVIGENKVLITSRKKVLETYPELITQLPESALGLECVILINGKYVATLRFRDVPREETKPFITHLKPSHQFNKIMLVSGDRESEVNYLGKLLNLTEIHASKTPEEKLEIVRLEMKKAPTLFIGDGINDAPALTAATVGVAFGQFNSVTSEAAGAVVMENTFNKVDELIHLSLLTRKIALQSAIGGMILSLIGMGFAAAGLISPVFGAILQEIIDVIAIMNALRLIWIRKIEADF